MVDVTIKDYQDWLKNNKQVKVPKEGETLSAFDEQENRALYNQYLKEAELLRQRQDAEARLSEQKASALRDNYVASEKAEKKAEDLAKMQGITTGASQSDLIDLYAKGAAARAGIIQANDNAKNDVFSAYSQALTESKASTNSAIADISAKRVLAEEEKRDKEKTEAEANFEDYLQQYLDGVIDKNALDSYYNASEEYIRDSLKNAYKNVENQKADAELSAAITNYGNGVIGYDELMNAYERAGEHVDVSVKDYIELLGKEKNKEELISKYNSILGQYESGAISISSFAQKQLANNTSQEIKKNVSATIAQAIKNGDEDAIKAVYIAVVYGKAISKQRAIELIDSFEPASADESEIERVSNLKTKYIAMIKK